MPDRKWSAALLVIALGFALSGCGTKQTLDQAINCDQFKRLSDGTWSATQDVSLNYTQERSQVQFNYAKGSTIGRNGDANVADALNKKCVPKP